MTCPSWVALNGVAHCFTELDKAVVYVIRLVSFLWLWFSFCLPSWRKIRGLRKPPDGRDWLRRKLGLILMGRTLLSKSLIQFSLIHGPNISCSYAILLFTSSDFTSIINHIHHWVLSCFVFISSFFLKLFLHWSSVAYWASTNLGSSSFSVLSFCLFILFMAFSRQEYWSGLPFPSPVDHVLSELYTMTRPS